MRKPRPRSDIPDWRDPEMPLFIPHLHRYVSSDAMHKSAQMGMEKGAPDYKRDPSYWWRKKHVAQK